MNKTTKDMAVKEMNADKTKYTQHKTTHKAPTTAKLVGLPLEELKYLRAEIRLG